MSAKKKTVYCLRTRDNDSEDWRAPEYFRTRKERDDAAATCRIIGSFRTHSYEEKVSAEAAEELLS